MGVKKRIRFTGGGVPVDVEPAEAAVIVEEGRGKIIGTVLEDGTFVTPED